MEDLKFQLYYRHESKAAFLGISIKPDFYINGAPGHYHLRFGSHGSKAAFVGISIKPDFYINGAPGQYHLGFCWSRKLKIGENHTKGVTLMDKENNVWLKLGSSMTYTPVEKDVGCILKLEGSVVDPNTGSVLATRLLVTKPIKELLNLPLRHMIIIGSSKGIPGTKDSIDNAILGMLRLSRQKDYVNKVILGMLGLKDYPEKATVRTTFKVMTYNILADLHVSNHKSCPDFAKAWEYRQHHIMREIIGYQPDIICLQEVQRDHLENFFRPQLEQHGYMVIFLCKYNEEFRTGRIWIRDGPDGCAIFFRRSKFRLVHEYKLEFREHAREVIDTLDPEKKDKDFSRLLKDNVAIVVILESMEIGNSRFCVANTHICANNKFNDVKLWQVSPLVGGLENLGIPVIMCGDLNSSPGSAPYNLLVRGRVNTAEIESSDYPVSVRKCLKLSHGLPMVSAYASLLRTNDADPSFKEEIKKMNVRTGEPQFTNYYNSPRTIDYILYSGDRFQVTGLLQLLEVEPANKTFLPSPDFPSDHIPLMAELSLISQKDKKAHSFPFPTKFW